MYWEITPYENSDFDVCVMPGNTENDHHNALEYAQKRLEDGWDRLKTGQSATVTIECCDGEVPELNENIQCADKRKQGERKSVSEGQSYQDIKA